MVEVMIGKIEISRAVTALLAICFLAAAPILGIMYGTTSAVTFGSFTLISPLELALVSISARTIPVNLVVPGLIVILIIVFFGRFFCGWICPMGILLENSHVLTIRKRRKGVGALWKNREKWAILLPILAASFLFGFTAPYIFSPPGVVYRTILSLMFRGVIGADLMVIFLILALDLFAIHYGRTWCNTICPLGTAISSLSFINFVKPKVDHKRCIDFDFNCLDCERICPMRIPVTRADRWAMMECNKCLKCWASCPVKAVKIDGFSRVLHGMIERPYPVFAAKKTQAQKSSRLSMAGPSQPLSSS